MAVVSSAADQALRAAESPATTSPATPSRSTWATEGAADHEAGAPVAPGGEVEAGLGQLQPYPLGQLGRALFQLRLGPPGLLPGLVVPAVGHPPGGLLARVGRPPGRLDPRLGRLHQGGPFGHELHRRPGLVHLAVGPQRIAPGGQRLVQRLGRSPAPGGRGR